MGIFKYIIGAIRGTLNSTSKQSYDKFMGDLSKMNPKENNSHRDLIFNPECGEFEELASKRDGSHSRNEAYDKNKKDEEQE